MNATAAVAAAAAAIIPISTGALASLHVLGYHYCPANPSISTSAPLHHHHHHHFQYSSADWLFSFNLLYLIAAPLLLRELPAMMATLDPLIDYLFEPSSWLAFPGWCAELWRLFREEKGRITLSRRNSADALHHRASRLEAAAHVPRRSRTW